MTSALAANKSAETVKYIKLMSEICDKLSTIGENTSEEDRVIYS